MPNGSPGDGPYTDIVVHGIDVYSTRASALVREIARFGDDHIRRNVLGRLFGKYNPMLDPDVPALERELQELRDKVVRDARERGFEVDEK